MADGFQVSSPNLEKNLAKLRNIAPLLDSEIAKAGKKNATELAVMAAKDAPVGEGEGAGELASSIKAVPEPRVGQFAWGSGGYGTGDL